MGKDKNTGYSNSTDMFCRYVPCFLYVYIIIRLFFYCLFTYLFNPSTYFTYFTTVRISSIYRVLKKSCRFYGSVVLTEISKKDQINVSPDSSVCLDKDNVRVIAASDALCGFHARQGNFSTLRLTEVRTFSKIPGFTRVF